MRSIHELEVKFTRLNSNLPTNQIGAMNRDEAFQVNQRVINYISQTNNMDDSGNKLVNKEEEKWFKPSLFKKLGKRDKHHE